MIMPSVFSFAGLNPMLPVSDGRYGHMSHNAGSPESMFGNERPVSGDMMSEQFLRAGSMAFMCTKLPPHWRSNKTLPTAFKVRHTIEFSGLDLFYFEGSVKKDLCYFFTEIDYFCTY